MDDGSALAPRAVVAFDNSGTLSDPTVVDTPVADGASDMRVPEVPPAEREVALVTVDHADAEAFDVDGPIGDVVGSGVGLHVTLANVECDEARARAALVADRETPAGAVREAIREVVSRADGARTGAGGVEDAGAVGVQLVVDLAAGRVLRVIAYTTLPRPGSHGVVAWARDRGFEPHIVSGDTAPILESVARAAGIDPANVHAYQSPEDKRDTVAALREATGRPVVMVGDYVNDRLAFEEADLAVFVDDRDDGRARDVLAPRADRTVERLADLPAVLDDAEFGDAGGATG